MCRLAGEEIDRGGCLNVEAGRGKDRRYLNITLENLKDDLPALFEILANPHEKSETIKFTILNRNHQKTDGFSAVIKSLE